MAGSKEEKLFCALIDSCALDYITRRGDSSEVSAFNFQRIVDEISPDKPTFITRKTPQVTGRNEPCPCGSGRKFKKCCLN